MNFVRNFQGSEVPPAGIQIIQMLLPAPKGVKSFEQFPNCRKCLEPENTNSDWLRNGMVVDTKHNEEYKCFCHLFCSKP